MSYTYSLSPLLAPLLANPEVLDLFSARADVSAMLSFELELAKAQEKHGEIPKGVAARTRALIDNTPLDQAMLDVGIARDGLAVPGLVTALKSKADPDDAAFLHKEATSQDVIDTSFMMRAKTAMPLVAADLLAAQKRLADLKQAYGGRKLMARTRMQAALPMTVANRIDAWANNLDDAAQLIAALSYPLQLGGPVGTYANDKVKQSLAEALGLANAKHCWHTNRTPVLAIGNACATLTGAVGKIGFDIALMAQNERAEITLSGSGTSSAMAHKQNPVKAEVLTALARYNASLISGLHNAAIHEQERSGAAWTLEWLVLPQMLCAAAGSARLLGQLLASVERLGT
jgi:3-carboxy-cis,cis-muconate cycloisomerase